MTLHFAETQERHPLVGLPSSPANIQKPLRGHGPDPVIPRMTSPALHSQHRWPFFSDCHYSCFEEVMDTVLRLDEGWPWGQFRLPWVGEGEICSFWRGKCPYLFCSLNPASKPWSCGPLGPGMLLWPGCPTTLTSHCLPGSGVELLGWVVGQGCKDSGRP